MKPTFSVKNFEKFQHYKDRSPPWIKLYNELLEDYAFSLLPDASKFHLVAIWLLASRYNNQIPLDPAWVSSRISATEPIDLNILRIAGFIEFDQLCSEVLAPCKQDAIPEREAETEEEKKELSAVADQFDAFWEGYPTDRNMSKKAAKAQWKRLSPEKRTAAIAALPAFKAYCSANSWYRPKHADGWLAQERFDGFKAEVVDPAMAEEAKDKADRYFKRGKYAETYQ